MRRVFRFLKFVVFFAAVAVLLGFGVMYLWNALIPDLFHGPVVTYWQAVGLLVLTHILFKGWGGRGCHGMRRKFWHHDMEGRLRSLSPEEREKFEKILGGHHHHHG